MATDLATDEPALSAINPDDLRTRSRADLVYDALRDAIWEGRFARSARVREEEVARSLGVSRTPVREALQRLQQRGLLVNRLGRGLVVAELGKREVIELYAMREILEGSASSASRRSIAATIRRCSSSDSCRRLGTRKVALCSSAIASCNVSSVCVRY